MTGKAARGKSQRDRFIETARALGADEDEAAFKAKLAVIARQKPMPLLGAKKKVPQTRHKRHKRSTADGASD